MKKQQSIFYIILMLASLGQVASDLYLPSLPAISHSLMAPVDLVQLSVATYMLGFAISPILYGPISDGIGRKMPIIIGVIFIFIGSIICLSTHSIDELIAGRFFQGLGGGCSMLSRAILRDVFSKSMTELAKFSSYLLVGNISIMASAPLLGSYLQTYLGWRSNFAFLTLYAVLMLVLVVIKLPETNPHKHVDYLKPKSLLSNLKFLGTDVTFIACNIMMFMTYAGIIAWLTAGPILLQNNLHLTPIEFGWMALFIGFCYAMGGLLNAKCVGRISVEKMLMFGVSVMACAGILMLITALLQLFNIWVLMLPIAIYIFGTSMVFANSYAFAMKPFGKIAGLAGSLMGFMQILGGAVASTFIAASADKTQMPLAIVFSVAGIVSVLMMLMVFVLQNPADATLHTE